MRVPLLDEREMVTADHGRLDLEDREVVDAAIGTSCTALKPTRVSVRERCDSLVDDAMKMFHPIDCRRGHVS
jgi:hypothetical protein